MPKSVLRMSAQFSGEDILERNTKLKIITPQESVFTSKVQNNNTMMVKIGIPSNQYQKDREVWATSG